MMYSTDEWNQEFFKSHMVSECSFPSPARSHLPLGSDIRPPITSIVVVRSFSSPAREWHPSTGNIHHHCPFVPIPRPPFKSSILSIRIQSDSTPNDPPNVTSNLIRFDPDDFRPSLGYTDCERLLGCTDCDCTDCDSTDYERPPLIEAWDLATDLHDLGIGDPVSLRQSQT